MKSKEGLVLFNGKIYTQEEKFPFATALAISGNRIMEIGKDTIAKNYPSARYRKVDLKGKTALPGFSDCHGHFLGYVQNLGRLNLEKAGSLHESLDLITDFSRKKRPGEWILGYNWDSNLWKGPARPDKKMLDQISTVQPMAFSARDGHQLWVNSLALNMAGINETAGEFPGGQLLRYEGSTEPTGILKDNARNPVLDIVPENVDTRLVKKAIKNLHRKGITSIHNMENGKSLAFFQELESGGKLNLRVWQTIAKDNLDQAISVGLRTGFGSEKLTIGGVKVFADGALGSKTALMFEPYENEPDNFGLEATSCQELAGVVKKASQSGISAVIHAIGDRAVYNAIQAIEAAVNSNALRHRIEHVQIVRPEDMDFFAKLNIVASFQPIHCPNDYQMALKYWGARNMNAYPIKGLLNRKVKICFGSDFPLYDFDPILGIYAAVNRTLPKTENPAWNRSQRITVKQAISAYTRNAVYAAGWEDKLGTLAPGKLADLALLSGDIYQVKPEEIDRLRVEAVIFDGRPVFGELY